jgi:hypothetical protein
VHTRTSRVAGFLFAIAGLLCVSASGARHRDIGARHQNGEEHRASQEVPRATGQAAAKTARDIEALQDLFESPPADARIMMRWWWFGPAVEPAELDRELRVMADAGIGGVEVQPVYPLALDDEAAGIRTREFLSDRFLAALRSTASTAARLGIRLDLTLGSGWPYGGPSVPIAEGASHLRHEERRVDSADTATIVPLPALSAGERLLAAFFIADEGRPAPQAIAVPAPGRGGIVVPPRGAGRLLLFVAGRTGMQVKRAAVGAEGFVLDHYDRAAVDHYLRAVGDRLLSAFPAEAPPYAIFCDSLEVYDGDWTPDLPEEFRRRRGYDLLPHLPALIGMEVGGEPADVRYDWGRTLTELLNERFVAPLQAWAHAHATRLRMQAYGIPPAVPSTSAHVDLPEGEGADWRRLTAVRWASSASHAYGVPVTSAETWTWLHSPAFRASPLDMKVEADRQFLQGVTQIVGHGWPYSPPSAGEPGWRFYAAGVFSEHNPWWIAMPDVARYLQRVSAMLRQGTAAADVLIYLPVSDAWAGFAAGRVNLFEAVRDRIGADLIGTVLDAGYTPELVDDEMLRTLGRIEGSRLRVGALQATTIILPAVRRMPPETIALLERFGAAGGHVIATRRLPERAPGLMAPVAASEAVARASARLFAPAGAGRLVTDERATLRAALLAHDAPDLTIEPDASDIGFLHRRTADADVYFVANTSNRTVRVAVGARTRRVAAESWDAVAGTISSLESRAPRPGVVAVSLALQPYESRFLVFTDRRLPDRAAGATTSQVIDVSSGWTVRFADGATRTMDRLESWVADPETRYFSGTATYERGVLVPGTLLGPGRTILLDFGDAATAAPNEGRGVAAAVDAPVREAAVVFVNGQRAGSVWCPPYALDVTAALQGGENTLRVVVGNLAINRMASEPPPSYRLLNLRYGVRFEPQDMNGLVPVASGLLGPIRLVGRARDAGVR